MAIALFGHAGAPQLKPKALLHSLKAIPCCQGGLFGCYTPLMMISLSKDMRACVGASILLLLTILVLVNTISQTLQIKKLEHDNYALQAGLMIRQLHLHAAKK